MGPCRAAHCIIPCRTPLPQPPGASSVTTGRGSLFTGTRLPESEINDQEEEVTMKKRLCSAGALALVVMAGLATLLGTTGAPVQAGNDPAPFADPAFQQVWTRTDQLVQQGQAGRSWF